MPMGCPYCGEDISEKARVCPKCGVILDSDTSELADAEPAPKPAAGSGRAATGSAGAGTGTEKKKKTQPCPKCEKPVSVSAHRCPSCGTAVRDLVSKADRDAEAKFQRTVKLGVAGAALLVVLVVLGIGLLSGGGPVKRPPSFEKVGFDDLSVLVGPYSKSPASRQKESWTRYHGKWVCWQGTIVDIEPAGLFGGGGALLIREKPGIGDADVRLAVPKSELAKPSVAIGKKVTYSGRLDDYGGSTALALVDGQVHDAPAASKK